MLRDVRRGLGATREPELVKDAADVVLHGLLREEEHRADLAVRLSFGELLEDLALLVGERREAGISIIAAAPHALEDLARDVGVEQRATFRHGLDRVDDGLA